MMNNSKYNNNFYIETFKRNIINSVNSVRNRSVGNYSKSYETWKRVENAVSIFVKELKNREGGVLKVLDLGCGAGYHVLLLNSLEEVRKREIYFEGIDISEIDLNLARETAKNMNADNVTFQIGNISDLNLHDGSYDIILCIDVVEHLDDPESCIKEIMRLLKPKGLSIITTPNGNNRLMTLKGKRNRINGKKDTHEILKNEYLVSFDGHGHISIKSIREWIRIFKQTGFIIESIKRGSILFGGYKYNKHPVLFAFILVIDKIFDKLFFMKGFSESLTYKIRKHG